MTRLSSLTEQLVHSFVHSEGGAWEGDCVCGECERAHDGDIVNWMLELIALLNTTNNEHPNETFQVKVKDWWTSIMVCNFKINLQLESIKSIIITVNVQWSMVDMTFVRPLISGLNSCWTVLRKITHLLPRLSCLLLLGRRSESFPIKTVVTNQFNIFFIFEICGL